MLVGLIILLTPKASSALVGLILLNEPLFPSASCDVEAASYWRHSCLWILMLRG